MENYLLVPIKETGNRLFAAMANPLELYALDGLRFVTQMAVDIGISPQKDILDAIERCYPKR